MKPDTRHCVVGRYGIRAATVGPATVTSWLRGIAIVIGLALSAVWQLDTVAFAEPGVFEDRIVFGQSAAFDGPAAALGLGMREGILAAFSEVNAAGGVTGHRLELVSYDDGYEPEKAIANTKRLISEDGVFALVGEVGTPTSNAAQPIATEAGVPFIGPFTGAAFLRNPSLGNVINIRGSYDQETEAWIQHLTSDLGVKRIAILYQDDTFGRAGLSGVSKALEKRNMKLVAEGTYERNTTAVKTALLAIRKARSGSCRDGGHLQTLRRVHQAGTSAQAEPAVREYLVRRRQRPRQRTW
jgi:branched-chain amino acid transport system substrate-binding protein